MKLEKCVKESTKFAESDEILACTHNAHLDIRLSIKIKVDPAVLNPAVLSSYMKSNQ